MKANDGISPVGILKIVVCLLMNMTIFHSQADNIIMNGTTVSISPGTSLVSTNHLTIQSGATLNNTGTLALRQNLANENPAQNALGTGLVELSGASNQVVSGQNVFQNLAVNNPDGVTIGGATRINGTLTMTTGRISLGDNHLLLGPAATMAGAPSALAMIVVTGEGELRREFPAGFTGSFTWPVGDATGTAEYSPVTLAFTSGSFQSGNFVGVTLQNSKFPSPDVAGNYLNRYWKLNTSGILNPSCNAIFWYTSADVTGDEAAISCTKVNPAPWVTYALANTTIHQLTANGIVSFGAFTGVKSTSVPANQQLANIVIPNGVVSCYDATQVLTVAGNGASFIVENGGNATLIAGLKIFLLPGTKVNLGGYLHGTIALGDNYCSPEANPAVAILVKETGIIPYIYKRKSFIEVYPNPTNDAVTIRFSKDENLQTDLKVIVYNVYGEMIYNKHLNDIQIFQFSLVGKPSGIYILHVQSSQWTELARIIKQ